MEVKQIAGIINTIGGEILGRTNLVNEDLSNIVDAGTEIFNADAVDSYVRKLVNQIGRMVFVDRVYRGGAPSVLMDGWEFGSVLEKVSMQLPDAEENESFELEDNASYDPNLFYKPRVQAKFFNKKVTFEVPISFAEKQVKQSFTSATQMNSFMSMIYVGVENSMTVKLDSLIMRTINNFMGETIYSEYTEGNYSASSGVRAVNLLKLFKDQNADRANLTAAAAITDPDFIRFASYTMGVYVDRLKRMSTLFNIGGMERFTPEDRLHFVMLSDFQKAANAYLQSDTFHDEFTRLPLAETVPYWQGSGDGYAFADVSALKITTSEGHTVDVSGILGFMFDRDALGVTNMDRRTTTNWNPKAEFFSNWNKMDAGYFNDFNENGCVFFAA